MSLELQQIDASKGALCELADEPMVEAAACPADVQADERRDAFECGAFGARSNSAGVFDELCLPESAIVHMTKSWEAFLQISESREAAGETVRAAIFDASTWQDLYKTPRAIMAMQFFDVLSNLVSALRDPLALKATVERLAFQHMNIEVTNSSLDIFHKAIIDMFHATLGVGFTQQARAAWTDILNYAGGACIHVRDKYSERLRLLASSWALACGSVEDQQGVRSEAVDIKEPQDAVTSEAASDSEESRQRLRPTRAAKPSNERHGKGASRLITASVQRSSDEESLSSERRVDSFHEVNQTGVPVSFYEMFKFNAAVMGCQSSGWMQEVLDSLDTIVRYVSNIHRLQEECDILSLRIDKYNGPVDLSEFKIVMLASLRSLVKDWGSLHELAWSWLWDNVERMLELLLGKSRTREAALSSFFDRIESETLSASQHDIFFEFFTLVPSGQDHFKQSSTRLQFIANKVFSSSLDMYRAPRRTLDQLSALGLRHVGYGISPELFPPFVSCCVKVIGRLAQDSRASDAFGWSLELVSRVLQRVIVEGSTAVMRAINSNSGDQVKLAVAGAPRRDRASWMLRVQVGTQSISPLMWAIESGSFDVAKAIIEDLLTIRADRNSYYYAMDDLFKRHPDIIKRLSVEAPGILPVLFDRLIWRSCTVVKGMRRVNYYIKHLIVDSKGELNKAIQWIVEFKDPTLACHPAVSLVIDMVWSRVAVRTFLFRKAWFFFTIIVFLLSKSVLPLMEKAPAEYNDSEIATGISPALSANSEIAVSDSVLFHSFGVRLAIIVSRAFIYAFSLGTLIVHHTVRVVRNIQESANVGFGFVNILAHLRDWQEFCSFCLTLALALLLCFEPLLRCVEWSADLFEDHCPAAQYWNNWSDPVVVIATLLYFFLLVDLAVFSVRLSAFILVVYNVACEVFLYLAACSFFVLAFASSMSCIEHDDEDFAGVPVASLNLFRIAFRMFSVDKFDVLAQIPALFIAAFFFTAATGVFLLNLLIAQISCAYSMMHADMHGLAKLKRGAVIVDTMPGVPRARWHRFVASSRFDERLEFVEGDIGVSGGVQVLEAAGMTVMTQDGIIRFGGIPSPDAPWPRERKHGDVESDRLERLEMFVQRAMKRLSNQDENSRARMSKSTAGSSAGKKSSKKSDNSSYKRSVASSGGGSATHLD